MALLAEGCGACVSRCRCRAVDLCPDQAADSARQSRAIAGRYMCNSVGQQYLDGSVAVYGQVAKPKLRLGKLHGNAV